MAGKKTHLTMLTDSSALMYDLILRSFLLGGENDFRQGLMELTDLAIHESTLSEAF
jgi:hypothetical protein